MSRHIIHKQKINLQVPNMEDAIAFQGRLSDLMRNELPIQMEAILDKLFPSDKITRIDSLQLDLGDLTTQNFEQEFKTRFTAKLVEALSAKRDNVNYASNSKVLSYAQSLVSSFIYFLETGNLPWYSASRKVPVWENELLNDLSAKEYDYLLDWLRDNWKQNAIIIQRLILQFSDDLLGKLISVAAPSISESFDLIYKDYVHLLKIWLNGKPVPRYEIWKYIFECLLNSTDSTWSFRVLKLLIDHFNIKNSAITLTDQTDINKRIKTTTVQNAFKDLAGFLKDKDRTSAKRETRSPHADTAETPFDEHFDNGKELTAGWSRDKQGKLEKEEDSLYVNNSGIVILHYFLKPFFEDLKLFSGGKFINDQKHQRAVLLLHYLATGTVEVAEYDLPLQKILCGYPLENTLPASIVLTRKEKAESKKLLNAVIDYWAPLRNTSIEGLRYTFLQRDGKLIKKENGWQLIVEQKTVDILLGKLPWGFSTIRLPWMEQILSVDWC
jgi:Contractile injection system tape measure protein